jgi:acetylornithine/succinyldiaminopimelate/putrescine aminotransferase/predicted amino acid dehydrogenase
VNENGSISIEDVSYERNCRPELARSLRALGLDAVYERALGDRLWRRLNGGLVEVLDLVGGFGANLFGHYHPDLLGEYLQLLGRQVPVLAQGSFHEGAARLAQALRDKVGDYVVIFTNSGAEAVEAAIKHSILEMRRPLFWAVRGAFHGKTIGAVQLTERYRGPYTAYGPRVRFLDPWDVNDWQSAEEDGNTVCAAFFEPVAGEGGIHPLPPRFVEWLWRRSRQYGFPLVADEIQSGMGRTGTFLASEHYGIQPDYICLSKALGGGLTKIGAVMIRRERFVEKFSTKHTSTFAEDDLSCFTGLKALEILDRDRLTEACATTGEWFLEELRSLCRSYPQQLAEARGCGLMLGLELRDQSESASNGLRGLSLQEDLGYLACAYLLNVHNIRVFTTLSSPFTLRIEPSAYIAKDDLKRFLNAASMMCDAIGKADFAHLSSFLAGRSVLPARDCSRLRRSRREPSSSPHRVGFIGHLLMPAHAPLWDPSLGVFNEQELDTLLTRTSRMLDPAVYEQINVKSATGQSVHLSCYILNLTPGQFMDSMRNPQLSWVHEKIQEAVMMARDDGCELVGLGGYTSIVTGNCQRLKAPGTWLTSGNALTVGAGISVLKEAAQEQGLPLSESRMAIVGATGNIGSACAGSIASEVRELVLVTQNTKSPRIVQTLADLRENAPEANIHVTDRMEELALCPLILCASNSPSPLVYPRHLSSAPAIICDLAVPGDVAPEVLRERPDVLVIEGGIIQLPCNPDFLIAGATLAPGTTYACVAETLLLGLEGPQCHGTYGAVTIDGVRRALALADKHGLQALRRRSTVPPLVSRAGA